MSELIVPDWPAPGRVRALVTTRAGGVSAAPYDSFNLAAHVGDEAAAVDENRARLRHMLPAEPVWLNQEHGTAVVHAEEITRQARPDAVCADASVTSQPSVVCAVLTADCLPVLFCDDAAMAVGAAHAGWRGLAAGVLEASVANLGVPPHTVLAWLGPAIGPAAFQVGSEVREAFLRADPGAAVAFLSDGPGRWMADLFALARMRLTRAGVVRIYGGGQCTHADAKRFYSYRRDGQTGRFASLIWLVP